MDRIPLPQFICDIEFLARKPIQMMYIETLEQIYIASKKMGLSSHGSNLWSLFSDEDPQKSNLIDYLLFR